ncbi:MAG: B12-binding domain-containing radical SAM protein, partial [Eubacteriales bacterium]|nr:B12-binding domain-containing radical SAM protein [Eubacteriales bacterium]
FMIGLPEEEMSDVNAIPELAYKVLDEYAKLHGGRKSRNLNVTISTSAFVPKPFTPFQWEAQDRIDIIEEKQKILKENTRNRNLKYNWSDAELSHLEAVFARGDRRTGAVLEAAWKLGCRFDGWRELFDYSKWLKAFEETGLEPEFYANRKREYDEVLPWDHIDVGVRKSYFVEESKRAHRGEITPACGEACRGCGVSTFNAGICP